MVVVVARLFFIVAAHVGQMLSVRERLISPTNRPIYRALRQVRLRRSGWWVGGLHPLYLFVSLAMQAGWGGMKTERLPVTLAQKNW